jgi:hypothetical protein
MSEHTFDIAHCCGSSQRAQRWGGHLHEGQLISDEKIMGANK